MRVIYSVIFTILVLALIVCSIFSYRSKKKIGPTVGLVLIALIPPVVGNLMIISSPYEMLSTVGCYIYFIGMDFVMVAMTSFTLRYCGVTKHTKRIRIIIYILLALDAIQLVVNIFTKHAFVMEMIEVDNAVYHRFVPLVGQTIHRVVDYGILAGIIINFFIKTIKAPKVYAEKYLVILLTMVVVTIWETIYIISRTPIDRSMVGFGVFGLLVFFFALFYRPMRLLDRMLAAIASKMPEALLFYDTTGRCIWINVQAERFLGIKNSDDLDEVNQLLYEKLGDFFKEGLEWSTSFKQGTGQDVKSYEIEMHSVIDDRERTVGSVLSIRDNSIEQITLEKETYNANHDPLTGVLNRAGYNNILDKVDLSKCFLLLLDLDGFKSKNDIYGHDIGDKVLIKVTKIIQKYFIDEDTLCRLGGDEFALVLENVDKDVVKVVKERVDNINKELLSPDDDLPETSISAGGAFGKDAENGEELFNNADHALYETKFNGKKGFTLFRGR